MFAGASRLLLRLHSPNLRRLHLGGRKDVGHLLATLPEVEILTVCFVFVWRAKTALIVEVCMTTYQHLHPGGSCPHCRVQGVNMQQCMQIAVSLFEPVTLRLAHFLSCLDMIQGPVPVDLASAHNLPCNSMLTQDLNASGCGSEAAEALAQHLPALQALDLSDTYLVADSSDQSCHLGNTPGLTRLLLNHAGRCSHLASHTCTGFIFVAQWRQHCKQRWKRRAQAEVQPAA